MDSLDTEFLLTLEKRLLRRKPKYALKLIERSRSKRAYGIEAILYDFYASHNIEQELLSFMFLRAMEDANEAGGELAESTDPVDFILRTPFSSVSLVFRHCFGLNEARRFLQKIVGPVILDVCAVGSDCEFSPSSKKKQTSLDWTPLIDQCRLVIETLTRMQPQHVPLCIKKAAYAIFESSKAQGRMEAMVAVSCLILGRFIADSLVAAFEGYGENDECAGLQRKLKICRAILRSVAEVEMDSELLQLAQEYNVPQSTLQTINSLMDRSGLDIKKFVERIVDRTALSEALKRNKERLNSPESQEHRLNQLIQVANFCQLHSLTSKFSAPSSEDNPDNYSSPRDSILTEEAIAHLNLDELEPDNEEETEDIIENADESSHEDAPETSAAEIASATDEVSEEEDANAVPPEEITEDTKQIPLIDMDGNTLEFKHVIAQSDLVLLVLLRHFGCNICRRTARELAQSQAHLASLGIKIVAIGNGTVSSALKFAAETKFNGSLFVDPSLAIYNAFNCHKGTWRTVLFNGVTFKKFFGALAQGYRPQKIQGDSMQLGGAFLIRRQRQVVYATCEEFAGDIEVSEIVRVSEILATKT